MHPHNSLPRAEKPAMIMVAWQFLLVPTTLSSQWFVLTQDNTELPRPWKEILERLIER